MHRALIFNGVVVLSMALLVFLIRGKQVRKALDEKMDLERRSRQTNLPMQSNIIAYGKEETSTLPV